METLLEAIAFVENKCSCKIRRNLSPRSSRKKIRVCAKCFKIKANRDFKFSSKNNIIQTSYSVNYLIYKINNS